MLLLRGFEGIFRAKEELLKEKASVQMRFAANASESRARRITRKRTRVAVDCNLQAGALRGLRGGAACARRRRRPSGPQWRNASESRLFARCAALQRNALANEKSHRQRRRSCALAAEVRL